MSITPLPSGPRPTLRARATIPRSLGDARRPARLARPQRRWLVALAKRVLPLVALALLLLVAFWPEIQGNGDRNRISYRRIDITPEGGQLTDAHYQGVDDNGRPYTVTATRVRQVGPERTDLEAPKADMQMQSGEWLMVQAKRGIFEQKANRLDLAGEVTLYRDDGTMLVTESASLDMRANAAAGHDMVHAEGPFGVLDAQGFTVLDRGAVVQFTGPARLVLNGDRK
jgi:lipopolysaccharide export system protein LptC